MSGLEFTNDVGYHRKGKTTGSTNVVHAESREKRYHALCGQLLNIILANGGEINCQSCLKAMKSREVRS